jgi:hypothetical protein
MIGEIRQRKRFPLPTTEICDSNFTEFTSGATMRPIALCFSSSFELITLCTPAPFIEGNLVLVHYPRSGGKALREMQTELTRPRDFYLRFPGFDVIGNPELHLLVTTCPHLVLFSGITGKKLHQISTLPTCIAVSPSSGLLLTLDKTLRHYSLDAKNKKLREIASFSLSPAPTPELWENFCILSKGRILLLLKIHGKTVAFAYSEKGEPLLKV